MNVSLLEALTERLSGVLEGAPKSQSTDGSAPPGLFADILANLTSEELTGVLEAAQQAADNAGQPALVLPNGAVVLQDALTSAPPLALIIQPTAEGDGAPTVVAALAVDAENAPATDDDTEPSTKASPPAGVAVQLAAVTPVVTPPVAPVVSDGSNESTPALAGTSEPKGTAPTALNPPAPVAVEKAATAAESSKAANAPVVAVASEPKRAPEPAEVKRPVTPAPIAPVDEERNETATAVAKPAESGAPSAAEFERAKPVAPATETAPSPLPGRVAVAGAVTETKPVHPVSAPVAEGPVAETVEPLPAPPVVTPVADVPPKEAESAEADDGAQTVSTRGASRIGGETVRDATLVARRPSPVVAPVRESTVATPDKAPVATAPEDAPAVDVEAMVVRPRVAVLADKPVIIDGRIRFSERASAQRPVVSLEGEAAASVAKVPADGDRDAQGVTVHAADAAAESEEAARAAKAPVELAPEEEQDGDAARTNGNSTRSLIRAAAESSELRVPFHRESAPANTRDAAEAHGAARQPVDAVQSASPSHTQSGLGGDTHGAQRAAALTPPSDPTLAGQPRPTLDTVGDYAVKGVRYLASSKESSISVRLVPESLGRLDLVVKSHGNGVEIHVAAASHAVRDAIELHIGGMKEALARDGVEVTRVTVSQGFTADTSAGSAFAGRQSGAWNGPSQAGHHAAMPNGRFAPQPSSRDFIPARSQSNHEGALNVFA